ncbi:MAG: hypothetical protein LUH10_00415 [Tannerellaceae bacterium]|nr:hypothetical protein [Tannerellaceae bacterium]
MTWEDITIGQFNEIIRIVEKHSKQAKPDEIQYVVELVSACSGKSKEELLAMPFDALHTFYNEIAFVTQPPKGRLNDKIRVNGKKYNVSVNIKDITTAQYIDYTETLKNDQKNIAMMCAIFCIPDGHTYNEGYHVTDLADEFYDHFKIVDAIGISFFFTKLLESYVKATLSYLKRQLKREIKKAPQNHLNREQIAKIRESITALEHVGGLI